MPEVPYYQDDLVRLYLGDCRDTTAWLEADVLVVDPPYGRNAEQRTIANKGGLPRSIPSRPREAIAGDSDTAVRDAVLEMWGSDRRALVFGDLLLSPPVGAKLAGIYRKPGDAGFRGGVAGFRRDLEAIYFLGPWGTNLGGGSALFTTKAGSVGGAYGLAATSGHRHAKPLDLMAELLDLIGPGVVADPCAGSGSTLLAAKLAGRRAIGVEVDEAYCERAAQRLSVPDLFAAVPASPAGGGE